MSYLKRSITPKTWPITRKGSAYVVRPSSNLERGLPLLIFLRDILKVAKNRNEVKMALREKSILINHKLSFDDKQALLLFDVVSLVPSKKNYMLTINEKGKFVYEEMNDKEANFKIAKIIGKKLLKEGKMQINLNDGRNFLSSKKEEYKTNDSVLVNLKEKKVDKVLPLMENANVLIIGGKNIGIKGEIKKLDREKGTAELKTKERTISSLIKYLIVTN